MIISEKTFNRILIGLSLARLGMMALLVSGVPKLIVKDGWYFHHGGDQRIMFEAALSVLRGQPQFTYVGAGMPLLMALLVRAFHATDYLGIIVPLVLLNGFLLGSLSVVMLGVLAWRLTGRRDVAIVSAGLWAFLPYIFYLLFGLHPDAELFRDSYVPLLLWASGLSEGPSMFLYLLGLIVVLNGLERRQNAAYFAAGVVFGFAGTIRIHTFASVAVVPGLLLLRRQWRGLAVLLLGMMVGYLPQFWYSHGYSGSAVNIPYLWNWFRVNSASGTVIFDYKNTPFAPQFLIANTLGIGLRHPEIALPGLAGIAIGLVGLRRMWLDQGWFKALLLFGSPVVTWLFHALTFVFAEDPFRFSIPAMPLSIIAGAYSAMTIDGWISGCCPVLANKSMALRAYLGCLGRHRCCHLEPEHLLSSSRHPYSGC